MSDIKANGEEALVTIARLKSQLRNLSDEYEVLSELMAAFSHDVKPMIRTIISFSGFLTEDYAHRLDDDGVKFLGIVGRTAARLKRMVGAAFQLAYPGSFRRRSSALMLGRCWLTARRACSLNSQMEASSFPLILRPCMARSGGFLSFSRSS